MLAYRFPPESNAIASRRPEGLYKHLPKYRWEPHVITRQNDLRLPNVTNVIDKSLAAKRAEGIFQPAAKSTGFKARLRDIVKRIAKSFPRGYDAYADWSMDAEGVATHMGRNEDFDLVWATLSPLSLAHATLWASEETGIPYVLDLRDPPEEGLGGIDSPWFSKALSGASAITVAAPSCITPVVLKNCAAPLLTLTGAWQIEPAKPVRTDKFHIVHSGTWHANYVAAPLFIAVKELAAESDDFSKHCRLIFLGKGSSTVADAPGHADIAGMIDTLPLMPYAGASALVASASVLLIARSSNGYKSQAITGKIFEYAPYEIPLLSIGGEDDLHATLVRWLGGTWSNAVSEIKDFLRQAFSQWQSSGVVRVERNPDALAYLSQQRMAAETATVMHAVIDKYETMGTKWVSRVPDVEVPLRPETPWPA